MKQQGVDQRAGLIPRRWMDNQSGRFVDDRQRLVLIQNVQRNVLRQGFRFPDLWKDGDDLLKAESWRKENYPLLHQNSLIIWRKRAVPDLPREGRPISQSRALEELYREREPLYRRFADVVIEETETVEEAVEKILEVLK